MSKFSKPLFILSTFLMATSHAWAINDISDFDSNEKIEEPRQEQTQTNLPENVQKTFHEQTKDYIAAIQEETKNFNVEDYADDPEIQYAKEIIQEKLKEHEALTGRPLNNGQIQSEMAEAIRNSMFGMDDPYCTDPKAFRPIVWHSFDTNSLLTSTAQQPLFLDNKEEFSVEIRPFLCDTNRHQFLQLGGILTARKQYTGGYVAGQFLYSYGEFDLPRSHTKINDILFAFTYGKHFNDFLGGSLTFSSGYSWSDFNREYGYISHPKACSLGLSPMLVYYLHTKVPVDLFLGSDLYYAHRFFIEESSRSLSYTYDAKNNLLWRIKAGPSYTMKSEGKRRLYQLRFSLAGNVQSQIPDRFTVAPNVLFESQLHSSGGGYLFELGLNLGKFKKLWNIAYGLRF